ncbi:MAG: hypothetical protein QGH37_30800 [Candidatus Poribacteria bacterium]|jgi:hypothetical protein|nr:hypothetical protein [Candidatus Poribacteria bacterium]
MKKLYHIPYDIISLTRHQQEAGYFTTTAEAIYQDGRNTDGELVSSGVYFYRL